MVEVAIGAMGRPDVLRALGLLAGGEAALLAPEGLLRLPGVRVLGLGQTGGGGEETRLLGSSSCNEAKQRVHPFYSDRLTKVLS